MEKQASIGMILLTISISSFAAIGGRPVVMPQKSLNGESTARYINKLEVMDMPNLGSVDNVSDDLNAIKRKLEKEKANVELRKLQNMSVNPDGVPQPFDNAQTTVTGVAINQEGKRIAWLQFTDGGSLMINIGSAVGKYKVTDITMSGVELSYDTFRKSKKITHRTFLKRAYSSPDGTKNQITQSRTNIFTPSPILTGANTSEANEIIPPISPYK